ncbi:hypothetical protein D3C86_1550430 [compost metagenome]
MRSRTFAAVLKTSSGFPSRRKISPRPLIKAFIFERCSEVLSRPAGTFTFLPPDMIVRSGDFSHAILTAFFACITCQVESPATTTNFVKLVISKLFWSWVSGMVSIWKTDRIPGIDFATEASNDLICMPNAGGWTIMAYNIPSTLKSLVNIGLPLVILSISTFDLDVPMILKSFIFFRSTFSGTGIFAASDAISPYFACFPLIL